MYRLYASDQDGTLARSFFDFPNSYLMPRKKPLTNYEKPLKTGFFISNALYITIKTNKKLWRISVFYNVKYLIIVL